MTTTPISSDPIDTAARAGQVPPGHPMPFPEADAKRRDLEQRVSQARAAIVTARAALAQREDAYREAIARGTAADQDAIEAAEGDVRRAQRESAAIELAEARHRPIWARAKAWALRAEAATHSVIANECQQAANAVQTQIVALQRVAADHYAVLQRELSRVAELERESDQLLRELHTARPR